MIVGSNNLGIFLLRFEELKSTVFNISIYPFKLNFEKIDDDKTLQVRLVLLNEYELGIFCKFG